MRGDASAAVRQDSDVEKCEDFCDAEERGSHCKLCEPEAARTQSADPPVLPVPRAALEPSDWCVVVQVQVQGVRPVRDPSRTHGPHTEGAFRATVHSRAALTPPHCACCIRARAARCKCHSAFPDDSLEEMCEPWCSMYQWTSHCQHCKCKSCGFCRSGVECHKANADDTEVEKCEPFCNKMFAETHCLLCEPRSHAHDAQLPVHPRRGAPLTGRCIVGVRQVQVPRLLLLPRQDLLPARAALAARAAPPASRAAAAAAAAAARPPGARAAAVCQLGIVHVRLDQPQVDGAVRQGLAHRQV